MAQTIYKVTKNVNQDAVITLPVGQKIYAFLMFAGMNVILRQNGVESTLISNTGTIRDFYLPCPLEFAAAAEIIFRSSNTAGTPAIIVEQ